MTRKPQPFRRSPPKFSPRVGCPAEGDSQRRRVCGSDPQLQRLRGEGEAAEDGEGGIQAAGGKRVPKRRRSMWTGAQSTGGEQGARGKERSGSAGGKSGEVAEKLSPSAGREMERLRDNLARMRREALGRALERAGREGRIGWAETQWLVEGMIGRGDGIRAYRVRGEQGGIGGREALGRALEGGAHWAGGKGGAHWAGGEGGAHWAGGEGGAHWVGGEGGAHWVGGGAVAGGGYDWAG
ncbi:unnamed protein product [Closterium sp. Yama58-4]|nr:unnamed protein product [Closterium sp. Yama58-4]